MLTITCDQAGSCTFRCTPTSQVLTWALCSKVENFAHLRRPEGDAVEIGNPATAEFEVGGGALCCCPLYLVCHT